MESFRAARPRRSIRSRFREPPSNGNLPEDRGRRRSSPGRISTTSWMRRTSAPSAAANTEDAIVPPRRSLARRPVDLSDEALARGPDDQRAAEGEQLAEPPQQLEVVLQRLAEADPRVQPDPRSTPTAVACSIRSPGSRRRRRPHPRRCGSAASSGCPACASAPNPRRCCAATADMAGSARSAETSLMIVGPRPRSRATATAALCVSIESGSRVPRRETFDHRQDALATRRRRGPASRRAASIPPRYPECPPLLGPEPQPMAGPPRSGSR